MTEVTAADFPEDFLQGARKIGDYLGMNQRSVFYYVKHGRLPVFRFKSQIWARKSTLRKWIEDQEKQNGKNNGRENPDDGDHGDGDQDDDH
jgi:hypothetical protein